MGKNRTIALIYEYKPNKFAQEKLDFVFNVLFSEIENLIKKERIKSIKPYEKA